MSAYVKFQPFVEHMAEKKHDLGADQLVVALTTNANVPANTNGQLSDIVPIAYTNLSTRNISTSTSAQTSGTYKLVLTDLVLTASGGNVATFRHVVIYNDTSTSDFLICMFDYGQDLTLQNGETFTLDFDGTNGLLQVA